MGTVAGDNTVDNTVRYKGMTPRESPRTGKLSA